MSDLPVITPSTDSVHDDKVTNQQQPVASVSYGGKEGEVFPVSAEFPLKAVGQEVELPKEVQSIGVQVQPTTVDLPQVVSDQGVQSVGHNVPVAPTRGTSITLPLTDNQIELALKKNTKHSIRWLAEWCIYQIKKMHEGVKQTTNHHNSL